MKQIIAKVIWSYTALLSTGLLLLMPALSDAGDDIKVIVPKAMRTCQVDADCTFVETRCSSCCDYIGINKKFVKQYYDQNYSDSCKEYKGPVCDCIVPQIIPACIEEVCELIEASQEDSENKTPL